MGPILNAVVAMGGIGLALSVVLGVASKVFYVYVDPKVVAVDECLPGANCGGCGYAGCSDCAVAMVAGKAPPNACKAGGDDVTEAISVVLGVSAEAAERDIISIFCRGTHTAAKRKYIYKGVLDCRAAVLLAGGDKSCMYGCLGLGTCVENCPFGALKMGEDGLPVVNENLCTGCGTCVNICPRHIPALIKESQRVAALCSSHDGGKIVKDICNVGCQGCGKCKKACPEKAIIVDKFLAIVDGEKCTGCGECFEDCPTGIIQSLIAA
ncbi:MAG: RnfABCDGE type electron transport complex subunit B [Desulfobacteraceae bacterium]|nr:RnfABCDGE type electron transport complex subunit B [Pseudomonadota bacterium]MBU4462782.1 RnfABCDGE type electron transport complex subunit B [Pseudomonadota bacterium]MCG2754059.1 RnfABCDGE type electron transport complex subunit B [Desulfobacteraceae bacterium]